jgi:hypothetical protein
VADAFYELDGDRVLATEQTRGPWDPGAQHAGPPSALLARALEGLPDSGEFQIGRITLEILRSIPIAPAWVEARVLRPGRRVQLVEAALLDDTGEVLLRATAWRLRRAEVDLPAEALVQVEPPPGPEQASSGAYFPTAQELGYHTAMECRFVSGGFVEPGPAVAWLRMRVALVAGEDPTPLQRLLVVADVGNGISSPVDYRRYLFINVELTVHIERQLEGEWVGADALTLPQPTGVGIAESVLFDQRGRVGRAAQTLLVSER